MSIPGPAGSRRGRAESKPWYELQHTTQSLLSDQERQLGATSSDPFNLNCKCIEVHEACRWKQRSTNRKYKPAQEAARAQAADSI